MRPMTSNRPGRRPVAQDQRADRDLPRQELSTQARATGPRTSAGARWLDVAAGSAGAMGAVLLASKLVDRAGVMPVAIGTTVAGGLGAVLLRGRWQRAAQGVLGNGVSQLCTDYLGRRNARGSRSERRNSGTQDGEVLPRRAPRPRAPAMPSGAHAVSSAAWPPGFASRLAKVTEPEAPRAPICSALHPPAAAVDPSGAAPGSVPTSAPAMSGPATFSAAQPRDERETAPTAPPGLTAPNEAGAPSSLHSTPARPPRPAARPTPPNERDEGAPPSAIAQETSDLLRQLQAMHRPLSSVASRPVAPSPRRTALGAIAAGVGSLATAPLRFVGGLLEQLRGPRALMLAVAIALMSLLAFVR